MRRINCYIPIKLCITGRLTDAQLDQLADTVVRTVSARIAYASRVITEGQAIPVSAAAVPAAAVRPPARKPAQPTRPRDNRLRATGPDTDENIYGFLQGVRKRFKLGQITTGRIKGNTFQYDRKYELHPVPPLGADHTISSRLGEGVFLLRPLPKGSVDPIQMLAGPAYSIHSMDRAGKLRNTGLKVVVQGFVPVEEGILIYTARTLYTPPVRVEVRRPRDADAIARKVIGLLGDAGYIFAPGVTVLFVLEMLESEQLTPQEVMEVLEALRARRRLADFLSLIQVPRLRRYLKEQQVPWYYVFSYWEPGINDSGLVFAGFMVGAVENVVESVRLLYVLTGSIFSEKLADERDQLFGAIKKFFQHPVVMTIQGMDQFLKAYLEALDNLDFFEAGRILGNAVVVVLTLPSAIKSLPRVARALGKAAVKLARLTAAQLRQLGITAEALRAAFRVQPGYQLATDAGVVMMAAGDDVTLVNKAGRALGRISKSDIDRLMRELDALEKEAPKMPKEPLKPLPPTALATAGDLRQLGITAEHLQGLVTNPGFPQMTSKGITLMRVGEGAELLDKNGRFIGKLSKGEISKFIKDLEKLEKKAPPKAPKLPANIAQINFDALVEQAIRNLKQRGVRGLSNPQYGVAIHTEVQRLLNAMGAPAGWMVAVETPLSQIMTLSPRVARMTVAQFLKSKPHIADQLAAVGQKVELTAKTLDASVGALKPDLVIRLADGSYILWDLTSQSAVEHWAKTLLYAEILAGEKLLVQFGETGWMRLPKPPSPANIAPSAGAAAKAAGKKKKKP